jgi:hypothetical protein
MGPTYYDVCEFYKLFSLGEWGSDRKDTTKQQGEYDKEIQSHSIYSSFVRKLLVPCLQEQNVKVFSKEYPLQEEDHSLTIFFFFFFSFFFFIFYIF